MTRIQRLMRLHRLMNKAGEHGSDAGGGNADGEGGSGDGKGEGEGGKGAGDGNADGEGSGEGVKPKPSDAEAKLLRDVMKQKTKATELETELTRVNAALKQFEGIDPAKVRALLAEQEELETKKLEAKGEYDRLTRQMAERHAAEKNELTQRLDTATQGTVALQRQIADLTVGSAFSQSKFVQDDLTLTPNKARVIYGSHFEFKDGQVIGFDKPAGASERTMLVDASGTALSFESALQKIIEADPDKDHLIRSKMKPGAGSGTIPKGTKKVDGNGPKPTSIDRIANGLKELAKAK